MANNFVNMQEDALKRAREMHQRGKNNLSIPQKATEPPGENKMQKQNGSKKKGDMLEFLLSDPDKTIILALLIILSSEKTDSTLIFALLYLLM